ncbi:hypothetical protein [Curtobacterium sp. MWU13-2055]|uniref:hypothetical protein n=1 Tax=Curtobacterium sp. MWU13-2055 TaxID=2931928 RepID=UPI00200E06E0|nr:hypothetical protein [Curtobacterium sp. MWU13-2055]
MADTILDQQNGAMTTSADLSWIGITKEQQGILETRHFIGNNGWDHNGQTDKMMPRLLECAVTVDLSLARIKEAMAAVGHSRNELPAGYVGPVDVLSAKVLGTIAFAFGLVFITTSVVRFIRPDLDVVLAIVNTALGIFWLGAGIWLWRFALRKAKRDR